MRVNLTANSLAGSPVCRVVHRMLLDAIGIQRLFAVNLTLSGKSNQSTFFRNT
jgi:hypothetical protein